MRGGLYHPGEPAAQSEFRDRSAIHAKMAGVESPLFICACCGQSKPAAGRKPVTPGNARNGYVSVDCQTIEMRGYAGHKKAGADYSLALRDRIKPLIQRVAMTKVDIATKADRKHSTVVIIIKKLKKAGLLHVEGWRKTPGTPGPMQALYIWGPGKDAEKPAPDTNAEKLQRYRNKNKGVHHSKLVQADPLMAALFGARK